MWLCSAQLVSYINQSLVNLSRHMTEHERGATLHSGSKWSRGAACRTALESQVREEVRIQQRGSVLKKRGEFNRCKLTRMDVYVMLERKCWDQA